MGPPATVGWFGRTFGWTGARGQWVALVGAVAWLAGAAVLVGYARRLAVGEAILLAAGWVFVLALLARGTVRDLFGPVFFYEAVRAGRQRPTLILRGLYAFSIGLTLALMYLSFLVEIGYYQQANLAVGTGQLARFATDFFHVFAAVQYVTVLLLTPVYVAGAIAVEKERKSLEFLLATDLRNREIVFGKVAARVLTVLAYVFAGLPVIALTQLFGGVDPELLLASFATTVITVIGLSAVSIWLSVMMRKARDAIGLAYVILLVYLFASFFAAAFSNFSRMPNEWWNTRVNLGVAEVGVHDVCWGFATGNAGFQLIVLAQGGGAAGWAFTLGDVVRQFATFWGIAAVLFVGHAVLRVRAVALHQSYGPPPGTRTRRQKVASADGGTKTVEVNVLTREFPPIGDNPVFWKEVFVEGSRAGCLVRVVAALTVGVLFVFPFVIVWSCFLDPGPWRYSQTLSERWDDFTEGMNVWVRIGTGVLATLMFFGAALRGAGAIAGERDKDTWVSLISVPLSSDRILWGKWWGCVLGQRRIFSVLVLVWSIGLATGAVHPVMMPFVLIALAVYVSGFAWVGLLCSMSARNTLVASTRAFFAALFVGGGFWIVTALCCFFPLSIAGARGRTAEAFGAFYLGLTPSFVSGWLPLRGFERWDAEPFGGEFRDHLGVFNVVIGVALWAGLSVVLAVVCQEKFRRLTNSESLFLPGERPR